MEKGLFAVVRPHRSGVSGVTPPTSAVPVTVSPDSSSPSSSDGIKPVVGASAAGGSEMPSVVPCPLRVDALFEMLGPDELLKVGLAGELECARHEGLWRSLCQERVLGIWSGQMLTVI